MKDGVGKGKEPQVIVFFVAFEKGSKRDDTSPLRGGPVSGVGIKGKYYGLASFRWIC